MLQDKDYTPYAMKIIVRIPPSVEWKRFYEGELPYGFYTVYALVNEGTEHECHSVTYLEWNPEYKNWYDRHGDISNCRVTHYLFFL